MYARPFYKSLLIGLCGFSLWRILKQFTLKEFVLSPFFLQYLPFNDLFFLYEFSFFLLLGVMMFSLCSFMFNVQPIRISLNNSSIESLEEIVNKIEETSDQLEQAMLDKEELIRELHCKRRVLRNIIDHVPLFIFAKDIDGKFFIVNKAVADCYGVHPRDIIGKKDQDFTMNGDQVAAFLKDDVHVIKTGLAKTEIFETITCDSGETRQLLTRKVPMKTWDGKPGVLGISVDITNINCAICEAESHKCNKSQAIIDILSLQLDGSYE
jgi:PAS domain S-box-containing protein